MIEKKMTISFTGGELESLEKRYNCDRKTLNLAIDYARAQFEEHINCNLHDELEDVSEAVDVINAFEKNL